jgi:DDE superfamily endonuclease
VILINEHTQRVDYLSQTNCGKTHDKKIADTEAIHYPPNATLDKDTGFQGYEPSGVLTFQPRKKPKGQDLGIADSFFNRLISSVRIRVEHVIASVKRCRIVKDVFRHTKDGMSDLVMRVACALHNWRITFRHPIPRQQLLAGNFR